MNHLLLIREDAKHLINLDEIDSDIGTKHGVIRKEDVLSAEPGDVVKTHIGKKLRAVKPSFQDLLTKMRRGPQIITLKDASFMCALTGVREGSKVLDAGTGSGLLTSYMAWLGAKVDSYDVRKEFLSIAKHNAELLGLTDKINFHHQDIYRKIKGKNYDAVTLDVPEPWKALKHVEKALKQGGRVTAYTPTIKQVMKYWEELEKKSELHYEKTVEILERGWKVTKKSVRPNTKMLGHTGFLVFARKY